MHSPTPRTAGRAGLAVAAAALLAFGLAAPAAADTVETYEGSVRAQYVGNHQTGESVTMGAETIGTNLFRLQLEDGSELITYCIDIETGIRGKAWYKEDDWADYPGKGEFAEPGKVHWILQHGYPSVTPFDLAEAAGSGVNSRRITEEEALAATQAAIWHYSNGATLSPSSHPQIRGIYEYLVESADDLAQEPAPTLSVTPDSGTGQAGDTVGEFQISTSAAEVPVDLTAPDGVELVDLSTGEPIENVGDGDKVGFSVPEDAEAGEASFTLQTSATIQQGRLFKGESKHKATQTLITAQDSEVTVDAKASVDWVKADEPEPEPEPTPTDEPTTDPEPTPTDEPEPKPTPTNKPEDEKPAPKDDEPSLPVTGGALAGLIAAGVAALGAGGGALYLSRKRKSGLGPDQDA